MKKNKLAFSAGILLVIIASMNILTGITYLVELISTIGMMELTITEETLDAEMLVTLSIMVCSVMIVLEILQAVAFMILGVKLIRKSNAKQSLTQMKTTIIVALVLSSIAIVFNLFSMSCLALIAVVILLACSLGHNNSTSVQTMETEPIIEDKEEVQESTQSNQSKVDLMVERAKALKDLKDKNVITQEEFETMIAKTLNIEEGDADNKSDKDK